MPRSINKNVAGAIDTALLGGANLSNAFSAIFNLSGNNLLNGLTQISGETATGSQQTTFNAMNQFMGVLLDPFIDGRGDRRQRRRQLDAYAEEDALAYAAKALEHERDAYAAIYRKAPLAPAYDPRWSVWAAAYGGSQTTERQHGGRIERHHQPPVRHVSGRRLSLLAEHHRRFRAGRRRHQFQRHQRRQRPLRPVPGRRVRAAQCWPGVHRRRPRLWLAGRHHRPHRDRGGHRSPARASSTPMRYSGRIEGGYRFVAPWIGGVGLTPYAAGQFTTFELPAYAEQVVAGANTFALAYNSKSVTSTRSELGLRADKSFALTNAVLTLRGRAAWAHDFNPDRNIAATFQTLPGASFVVNGAAQASNSALTTASAEMKWMNGWSAAGEL